MKRLKTHIEPSTAVMHLTTTLRAPKVSAAVLTTEFLSKPWLKQNLQFIFGGKKLQKKMHAHTHTLSQLPVTNLLWEVDSLKLTVQTPAK